MNTSSSDIPPQTGRVLSHDEFRRQLALYLLASLGSDPDLTQRFRRLRLPDRARSRTAPAA